MVEYCSLPQKTIIVPWVNLYTSSKNFLMSNVNISALDLSRLRNPLSLRFTSA